MQIGAHKYKDLYLVDSRGMTRNLRHKIMRKRMGMEEQILHLDNYAILICCNFAFKYPSKNEYSRKIKAICHPFRKEDMFPKNIPKFLLSESDFCDRSWIAAEHLNVNKKWDLLYFTINSFQGARCKGLGCLPLLDEVTGELGIRTKVIDYSPIGRPRNEERKKVYEEGSFKSLLWYARDRMDDLQHVDYGQFNLNEYELNKIVQQSRVQFFPNTRDASPRMIPEALIRGTPVIVNKNIWGGWKYVNRNNGVFFKFPLTLEEYLAKKEFYKDSMKRSIELALTTDYDHKQIKAEYYANYGLKKTANKLAKIVNDIHNLGTGRFKYAVYANEFESFGKNFARDIRTRPPKRKRLR